MINLYLEQMEQVKWDDGSKVASASSDTISGRLLHPNSGVGSTTWSGGIFMPYMPAPPGQSNLSAICVKRWMVGIPFL